MLDPEAYCWHFVDEDERKEPDQWVCEYCNGAWVCGADEEHELHCPIPNARAWAQLFDMRGDLHYHDGLATWLVSYPTGDSIAWAAPLEGAMRGRCGNDDPILAVERAHRDWTALGRPMWPLEFDVEIGEEDPNATQRQRRPDEGLARDA